MKIAQDVFRYFVLIGRFRTLRAVWLGCMLFMPFIIIESFDLLFLSVMDLDSLYVSASPGLLLVWHGLDTLRKCSANWTAILAVMAVSWGFARMWGTAAYHFVIQMLLSVICFLIFIGYGTDEFQQRYMGHAGLFYAVIVCIAVNRSYIYFVSKIRNIRLPDRYRTAVNIQKAVPCMISILLTLGIVLLFQTSFLALTQGIPFPNEFLGWIRAFFFSLHENFLADFLFTILTQILWFFGIHGEYVLYNFAGTYLEFLNMDIFTDSMAAGSVLTPSMAMLDHVFVNIGGPGALLPLLFAIFISCRNKMIRLLGAIALFPVLFNIGDILIFGIPLMLNPVFLIPFICVPLMNLMLSYCAIYLHILPAAFGNVPWILPVFMNGIQSTASISGLLFQCFLICIDVLIYIPFVKLNDKEIRKFFQWNIAKIEQIYFQLERTGEKFHLMNLKFDQQNAAELMIQHLNDSIEKRELFMLYQPQFDRKGNCIGAEALLRWNHPECGYIAPPLIIALAKEGHLLRDLDRFILNSVCRDLAKAEKELQGSFKISVNMTGRSLKYEDVGSMIDEAVKNCGVCPNNLWIEVTERDALEGSAGIFETLRRIRDRGHHLLIDDFGMGQTSIRYLNKDLFDTIKLDKSITRDVLKNTSNQKIIGAITELVRKMEMDVIAEYVETEKQREMLEELGCLCFQGSLYSMPVPFEDMLSIAAKHMKTSDPVAENT